MGYFSKIILVFKVPNMADNIKTYALDTEGNNPDNFIKGEQATLSRPNNEDFAYIIPKFAPFFTKNFRIYTRTQLGVVTEWVEGVDFHFGFQYLSGTINSHLPMYGCIVPVNQNFDGTAIYDYRTCGGNYTLDEQKLLSILNTWKHNPVFATWDNVVNPPYAFPVNQHLHNVEEDTKGYSDLIEWLKNYNPTLNEDQIMTQVRNLIAATLRNITKSTVGLGLVENLGIVPENSAATNDSNDYYLTPKTGRLIAKNVLSDVDPQTLGVYTKSETDNLLRNKLNVEGTAVDSRKLEGYTRAEVVSQSVRDSRTDGKKGFALSGATSRQLKPQVNTQGIVSDGVSIGQEYLGGYRQISANLTEDTTQLRLIYNVRGHLDGTNLNDLNTTDSFGIWYQGDETKASLTNNYPTGNCTGTLLVIPGPNGVAQIYYSYHFGIWYRYSMVNQLLSNPQIRPSNPRFTPWTQMGIGAMALPGENLNLNNYPGNWVVSFIKNNPNTPFTTSDGSFKQHDFYFEENRTQTEVSNDDALIIQFNSENQTDQLIFSDSGNIGHRKNDFGSNYNPGQTFKGNVWSDVEWFLMDKHVTQEVDITEHKGAKKLVPSADAVNKYVDSVKRSIEETLNQTIVTTKTTLEAQNQVLALRVTQLEEHVRNLLSINIANVAVNALTNEYGDRRYVKPEYLPFTLSVQRPQGNGVQEGQTWMQGV